MKKRDIFIFIGLYAAVVLFAVNNFMFPDFDWFNYRFYNCWSFLSDRMSVDFLVGNLRTCFSPLIDLPEYFLLFKLNFHPYLFSVICLFDNVLLLFLVYKISEAFFSSNTKLLTQNIPPPPVNSSDITNVSGVKNKYILRIAKFFPIVYVIFSPIMLQQLSFDQNDVKIAVLVLFAFFLFMKNIFLPSSKKRNAIILLCGFITGIATGLKLTACIYAISFCLILLILYKNIDKPFKSIFLYCIGFVPSFLLVDGFWLLKCYHVYKNPLFPYFNNIFKSGFAEPVELLNQDYSHLHPRNFVEFIFYPFQKNLPDKLFGNDNYSWDVRYAINFISVFIFFALALISKYFHKMKYYFEENFNFEVFTLITLFSVVPIYVNISIMGTYRYVIASSVLFGIILIELIIILCNLSRNSKIYVSVFCAIFLSYVYATQNLGYIEFVKDYSENRSEIYSKVYEINNLEFRDNSVVILLNSASSAAIVKQNPNVQYVGAVLPEAIFDREEEFFKVFDVWYKAKNLKSKYDEKLISDVIASDKIVYVVLPENEYFRFSKEGLFYLDKGKSRILENCAKTDLKLFNNTFWATEIIKCEFNKK